MLNFKSHLDDLCEALATTSRRICTEHLDPVLVTAFVACRLITLDKNPGVRPIGTCECSRRIVGKAILSVLGENVRKAAGSIQLCAGQPCGVEAAIHAMQAIFEEPETEKVLLVDAKDAFNSLNRRAALINFRWFCPSLSTVLINLYRDPAQLFVGSQTLLSSESTTQGDPLAVAILPLICRIANHWKQVWYADDATGGGRILQLRSWWDALCEISPSFGHYPNAEKTWLLSKRSTSSLPKEHFETQVGKSPRKVAVCSKIHWKRHCLHHHTWKHEWSPGPGNSPSWRRLLKRSHTPLFLHLRRRLSTGWCFWLVSLVICRPIFNPWSWKSASHSCHL